jgi:hypothetical protein
MAITVQNGSLVVRSGAIGTGPECCCGGFIRFCSWDEGCDFTTDPNVLSPGQSQYASAEECQANCVSLGYVCDQFSFLGPEVFSDGTNPSPYAGPFVANPADCVPSYTCGDGVCIFSGYRDINTITNENPGFFANADCDGLCSQECLGACDEENPCPEGCECIEGTCQNPLP